MGSLIFFKQLISIIRVTAEIMSFDDEIIDSLELILLKIENKSKNEDIVKIIRLVLFR